MSSIIKPDDHTSNIKKSVDTILGGKTSIKRIKKQSDDHRRILFSKIIESIVTIEERSILVDEMLGLDMRKYNNGYIDILDLLMEYSFTKKQMNIINFFMYDRYTEDGLILPYVDEEGKFIKMDSPEQLYDYVKNIK